METLQLFFALITVILPNLPNKLHVAKKWNSPFCGNWLSILGCQSFIPDPWFFPGNQHHKYISCCDYLLAEQYYYSLWVESIGKGVVLSGIDNIKKSVWKQEALKKNKQTKEKETLGMLLTVIESVGKSIDPLAIHCLVINSKVLVFTCSRGEC